MNAKATRDPATGAGVYKIVFLHVLLIALCGCATPYSSKEGLLGGCKDEQVQPDIYRISCQANAYTARDKLRLQLIYRCAELTLEKGGTFFADLGEPDIKTGPKTIYLSPSFTAGFPAAPRGIALIKIFRGDKPVEYPSALDASTVKAEIEPLLFKKR